MLRPCSYDEMAIEARKPGTFYIQLQFHNLGVVIVKLPFSRNEMHELLQADRQPHFLQCYSANFSTFVHVSASKHRTEPHLGELDCPIEVEYALVVSVCRPAPKMLMLRPCSCNWMALKLETPVRTAHSPVA